MHQQFLAISITHLVTLLKKEVLKEHQSSHLNSCDVILDRSTRLRGRSIPLIFKWPGIISTEEFKSHSLHTHLHTHTYTYSYTHNFL